VTGSHRQRARAEDKHLPLKAIVPQSLADKVFERLGLEIVEERYAAGSQLPLEQAMADSFDVNRRVVREAVQRLARLGIVEVIRGGGARVLDFKRTAGLEVMLFIAQFARSGEGVATNCLAVLEMRAALGADVVRLCALRATPKQRQEILSVAKQIDADTTDPQLLFGLEARFWNRIVDGSQNLAYRMTFNSLMKTVTTLGPVARQWFIDEIRSTPRVKLAVAVASGDYEQAEVIASRQLRGTAEKFARQLVPSAILPEAAKKKK
jgi:DNA-binding FadR family transcriptional regulator